MSLDEKDTPMTRTVWTPYFDCDTGQFLYWVEIGKAAVETGINNVSAATLHINRRVIGYESGYLLSLPHGEQPQQPPPQKVIDAARFDAEERNLNEILELETGASGMAAAYAS